MIKRHKEGISASQIINEEQYCRKAYLRLMKILDPKCCWRNETQNKGENEDPARKNHSLGDRYRPKSIMRRSSDKNMEKGNKCPNFLQRTEGRNRGRVWNRKDWWRNNGIWGDLRRNCTLRIRDSNGSSLRVASTNGIAAVFELQSRRFAPRSKKRLSKKVAINTNLWISGKLKLVYKISHFTVFWHVQSVWIMN